MAAFLAVNITFGTGDPLYAAVVSWALAAIANEKGWESMKVRLRERAQESVVFKIKKFLS